MTLEKLMHIKDNSSDFLELYRIILDFTIVYRKILDGLSDDIFNSNNILEESVSDIFKNIDDIRTSIDIITDYIVR